MNYRALMSTANAPASRADMEALAALVGRALPDDHARLLEQADGGRFNCGGVRLPPEFGGDTVLNDVLPVGRDKEANVQADYEMLRATDRIPVASIPFADDPAGNAFLLSLEPDSYGAVFFWDHEQEPSDGGELFADFPNVSRIAPSFEAFIRSLEAD